MIRLFLTWLWPTLFEREPAPEAPVVRIVLPPEPMYRDPTGDGEWQPL